MDLKPHSRAPPGYLSDESAEGRSVPHPKALPPSVCPLCSYFVPVVHLDASVGVYGLAVFKPGDAWSGHPLGLADEAPGAGAWTGQALRPLHQRRGF